MTEDLRPYQLDIIERARDAYKRGIKRVLIVLPTGGGKTRIFTRMIQGADENLRRVIQMAHTPRLTIQAAGDLGRLGVEHGWIRGGRKLPDARVNVAMVGTLARRLDLIPEPDMAVIDEAHRVMSPTYLKIVQRWGNAFTLGFTGTPSRLDGRGLGNVFEEMIVGPSMRELIADGYLADYIYFAPPNELDVSAVGVTSGGDYRLEDLEAATNKPGITGNAVEHYLTRLWRGARVLVFAVTVAHAEAVARAYLRAGVIAAVLHGGMGWNERDELLLQFAKGRVPVLISVNVLGEGTDVPECDALQLLRRTKSLVVYRQQIGRGARKKADGRKFIVLDHVGNVFEHGLPDEDIEWSLESGSRGNRAGLRGEGVWQCKQCYAAARPGLSECPVCGAAVPVKLRVVRETEGELKEMSKAELSRQWKFRQAMARTLDELTALGREKGMQYPHVWAQRVMDGRKRK